MTDLARWTGCPAPAAVPHQGRYVRLEPLVWDVHGTALAGAVLGPGQARLWHYLPSGPFEEPSAMRDWVQGTQANDGDWLTFAICPEGAAAAGMLSYMRQRPQHGSIEVGCILYGPALAKTRAATEAVHLLLRHAFDDLGYRRFEWKCDAANTPSRRAAERLGFVYEGTFRNDSVVKGRNRDTAWYAIISEDWPAVRARHDAWLMAENFDDAGRQRHSLAR